MDNKVKKENLPPEDKETLPAEEPLSPDDQENEEIPNEPLDAEKLLAEAESLSAELAESKDKYLRLLAEYDNYRKRSIRDRETAYLDAKSAVVLEFLPVYDNLERALSQHTEDEAYYKGVELIMNQYKDILKQMNISSYGESGESFDPEIHSGVMHVEDEALGENVIAEVFQKGFRLDDRIIRFAMVKVAN